MTTEKSPEFKAKQVTKYTEDVGKVICQALASNHFLTTAAALAGVKVRTVYLWLEKGREGIEPYATFAEQYEEATAVGEGRAIKTITDASNRGDTRAAQFLLERRYRDRWGRSEKIEVGGDPDRPLVVQLAWPGSGGGDAGSALPVGNENDVLDAAEADDGEESATA